MTKKKVIIIGAGIGGLATAIQLAKKGYEVKIYEKTDKPGGRCQHIVKDGHMFDTGPTMFIFPDLYEKFFETIGENLTDYVKLIKTDPTYKLHFADNKTFELTQNEEKMKEQLESFEAGSFKNFQRYLEVGKKLYNFALNRVIIQSLPRPWDFFNFTNLFGLIRYNALLPHYLYTKRFFKDSHLNTVFTFQDSYLSLNPYTAPAMFSLFSFAELQNGSFLPEGGMYKIIEALVHIAKKSGVAIEYSSPIMRIDVENGKAKGVVFEDGKEEDAEIVVANADMTYAYEKFLPEESYTKTLQKKKYSNSAVVFHWALDKEYPQLNTHNLFFTENYKQGFTEVLNRAEPPARPHFYVQAPSKTDKTRAPAGQDTWSVMIPINRIYSEQPVDWKEYREKVRKYVFERLAQAGLEDVKKHIKFEISYLPTDWQSYLNLTNGSIYGLDHNLLQVGYMRPQRRHRKYKNLFFVGSDTHPGSGLPTVLLSSIFTTEKISQYTGI